MEKGQRYMRSDLLNQDQVRDLPRARLPDFLIIGAAKSGTTSLYYYLEQHPEIFMSANKEPSFFAYEGVNNPFHGPGDERRNAKLITNFADYVALFQNAAPHQKCGEASVVYLYHPDAPRRIHEYSPQAKLIVLLRDPVDRAMSAYQHLRRDGYEKIERFDDALRAESDRIDRQWQYLWHYRQLGFYGVQVERYLNYFPREQILILKSSDLRIHRERLVSDIFSFVGVDATRPIDTSHDYNISGRSRSAFLQSLIKRPSGAKRLYQSALPVSWRRTIGKQIRTWNVAPEKPDAAQETLRDLRMMYTEDILHLQEITGMDFSEWLEFPEA